MKIQSITPTENFKYNNSSFKATFVNNKLFRQMWQKHLASNIDEFNKHYLFSRVEQRFTSENVGHVLEILDINSPKKVITVLNHSNGIKVNCQYNSLFYFLRNMDYTGIFIKPPTNQVVSEHLPIFVKDDNGFSDKLMRAVNNDAELKKAFDYLKKRRGGNNRFEILDYRKYDNNIRFEILNLRNCLTSVYVLIDEEMENGGFKALIEKMIKNRHLYKKNRGTINSFMRLTGQKQPKVKHNDNP